MWHILKSKCKDYAAFCNNITNNAELFNDCGSFGDARKESHKMLFRNCELAHRANKVLQ